MQYRTPLHETSFFFNTTLNPNDLGNGIKCDQKVNTPLKGLSVGGLDVCFLEINVLSLSLALLSASPCLSHQQKKGCVTIVTRALDTSEQGFKIENTHYTACVSHQLALLCQLLQDSRNE